METGASQEPERPPGPDLNTRATRSSRPPCSRTLLGQLPAFGTSSLRRTRLCSGWDAPEARAAPRQGKFSKGKTGGAPISAPAPQTPPSRGRQEKLPSGPPRPLLRRRRPERRPGAGEPSDSAHRDAGAPSCVHASRRRVTAGKPHFPECLAWPHRRRGPLSFPWETRPLTVEREAVAPFRVPWS